MERLTQWIDENRAIPRVDLRRCGHERCTTQLARYEDTGLAPEQIEELLSRENTPEITRSSRDNDGWIPVEERLPGIGRKVLVSFRYTGWQPVIAFLSEEHRWLMLQGMKGYNDVTHDVSAWMPLPKPYHPKSEDWKENLLKKFDKRT